MEPWKPPGPRRFYPGRTLRTLHLAALSRFQAGILLLRHPMLASNASDQVRSLIELAAHGAWVTGAGGLDVPMTPRARAICVELGMARALSNEVEFLESTLRIPFHDGYIADKRSLVDRFVRLHAPHNCTCGGQGRRAKDVRVTLRALNDVEGEDRLGSATLLYGMWLTFSRAVHFPRLESLAAKAPGGAAWTAASITDRAVSLYNLVLVQGLIADFAASPYPAAKRQIGVSAMFLFDDLRRLTGE
jgi:hypothetical protein